MGKKIGRGLLVVAGVLALGIGCGVTYVELTHERDFGSTPMPEITASTDPKVIEQGAYVAHALAHCSACHGNAEYAKKRELPPDPKDLRGGNVMKAGPFGTFYPSNLTSDPETGLGKISDGELARAIRHGVASDGRLAAFMSFAVGPMADEDLTALVSYLRTLPAVKSPTRRDEWGFVAKALAGKFGPRMTKAPKYVPASDEPSVERGEYLANGPALCFGCHTPTNPMAGFAESGPRFSGGAQPEPDHFDERYEIMAPNLTPHPETGALNAYTEESFVDRVKKIGPVTRGTTMPWDNFKQMTDADLRSIFRYLRTVPPIARSTGPGHRERGWKPSGT